MSKPVKPRSVKARLPLRLLAGMFGVLLLTYLVRRAGPAKLLANMATLGWGVTLVIAWGGVSHLVKTWAWRVTLLDEKYHVSFPRMFGLRLASEAVGQLGAFGQLFGETLRVSLLSPTMPLASGITSVTLDRALFIITAALVSITGLVAVLSLLRLPHTLSLYAGLFVVILLAVVLVTALAVRKRWPVFSGTARMLGRVRHLSGWMERKHSLIHSVENKLHDFYHRTPGAFWGSFALNLAYQGTAVCEVYLILWLMSARISFFGAFAIEALTKLVNVVGVFNPGNIGTYEGGSMLVMKLFGLSATTGLTVAFARRLRAIFWAAVGGLCLVVLSKSRKQNTPDSSGSAAMEVGKESATYPEPPKEIALERGSHIAVIPATDVQERISFGSALPRVGSLPVLLRAILGAQRAGASRIVIVVDRLRQPWVLHDLRQTQRLPQCVEWFECSTGETSLPSLLGQLAAESRGNLALIAGDRTYHPSLYQRTMKWDGEGDPLALMTDTQLVGMYALSRDVTLDLAQRCPPNIETIEQLHDWLISTHPVHCESVPEDKWQRVLNPSQRLLAEEKLDCWLVKPTDGIFARMNRRISVPISRQIIRFPITPNMVTLFTLGVSFISGVFFAFGGYWNMLVGAVLSLLASILDGCDGEVARLTFLESDFGCWLETLCDYLYYLFIFAGMTIGIFRSSGLRIHLVFGGLLVFGAVASFLTIGMQRRQLAAGRPEQYLGLWHKEVDGRRFNPLLYLGRHTEFIIRRCFLPYAFLFFALFNIVSWAFIGAAVGANLVWPIALYSYISFTAVQISTAASPAPSPQAEGL